MPKTDGSVVFSTALDNKELEKDLERTTRQVEHLEKELAKKESDRQPIVEQLKAAKDEAVQAYSAVERLQKELAQSRTATSIESSTHLTPDAYAAELERQEQLTTELKEQETILRTKEKAAERIAAQDERALASIQRTADELNRAKEKAGGIAQQLASASKHTVKMDAAVKKARKSMDRFAMRLREVTRSALIFTLITQSLAKFREWMGKVVKTNAEASAAVAKLKGALLTLAQPLVDVIIPAFTTLVTLLAKIVTVAAQALSAAFGKTTKQSAEAAQALKEQMDALEGVGDAAEDSAKSLAGFDEINKLSGDSASDSNTEAIQPDFSLDADLPEEQLQNILGLVTAIGIAFLSWKLSSALGGGLGNLAGSLLAIAGVIIFAKGIFDGWANGVSWENLQQSIFGLTALVAGLFVLLGPTAAGIGLIVGGLVMLATGFKDAMENGWGLENTLMSITGIIAAGLGISVLTGSVVPAVIAGIAAILLALTVATGHGEELLDGVRQMLDGFVGFFVGLFTGDMERAIGGLADIFGGLDGIVQSVIDSVKDIFDQFFVWLDEKTGGKLSVIIGYFRDLFDRAFRFIKEVVSGTIDSVRQILEGLIIFLMGVFTGDFDKAWQGVKQIFFGIWNGIVAAIESAINFIIRGINWLISQLNKISFTAPDWVPGIGGKTIGINIPAVKEIQIPRLATGAVIPPNREFLAVLGDQTSGNNIEAPEDLIRKIVREESGGANTELLQAILEAIKAGRVLKVDKRVLAETAADGINDMTKQAGKSVLLV